MRIDFPGDGFAVYRYDADGRRIEKDVDGTLTRYVYDDDAIALEFDGSNALTARYSHGEAVDQPLVLERGGQSHFYHVDFLGSVRKLTNAAGTVVNTYDTDAYGNFETRSEAVANPYTYTAREFDAESGLHFYRARYYDPVMGRFISEDPIGLESGDVNSYRYVFNNPVMLVDPKGEASFGEATFAVLTATAFGFVLADLTELAEEDIFPGIRFSDVDACRQRKIRLALAGLGGAGGALLVPNPVVQGLFLAAVAVTFAVESVRPCEPNPP